MLKHLFSFNGKIGRLEYAITLILCSLYTSFVSEIIKPPASGDFIMFLGISIIPILVICFASGAKRCHDLGVSGWYQIIPLYVLVMLFKNGVNTGDTY